MDVTLIVIRDQSGTIGTLSNGIPWDYSGAIQEISKLIKGNTVIFGRTAYNMFSELHKVRTKHKTILSKSFHKSTRNISYCNDPYIALANAVSYGRRTYIIGGVSTMRCFLKENLIHNICFMTFCGHYDGVKFINDGTNEYVLSNTDKRGTFTIQNYSKVPNELKIGSIMESLPIPSSKKLSEMSDDDIMNEIDSELMDEGSVNRKINELYDCIGTYADNQVKLVDRMNNVITTTQSYTAVIISLQDRIKLIEEEVVQLSNKYISSIVTCILCFVALVVNICLR